MAENQDFFKKVFKEHGLKITAQRAAILEIFHSHRDSHLTVEEIYDFVKTDYPDMGLATVYRTVQLLSELELIDKVNLDGGCARYELGKTEGAKSHRHHHLICLNCGAVSAFGEDMLDSLEEHIEASKGFQVVDHEVKLFGYCKKCRKQNIV